VLPLCRLLPFGVTWPLRGTEICTESKRTTSLQQSLNFSLFKNARRHENIRDGRGAGAAVCTGAFLGCWVENVKWKMEKGNGQRVKGERGFLMHSAFINMQLTLAGVASAIKSINSICKLRQLARSQGGFARRWLPVLVAGYWLLVTSAFAFAFAFAFQSANKGAKKIPSYDQNKKQLLQPAAAGEKLMRNSDSAAVHLLSTPIAIVLNNLLSLLLGERTLKSGPTNRR